MTWRPRSKGESVDTIAARVAAIEGPKRRDVQLAAVRKAITASHVAAKIRAKEKIAARRLVLDRVEVSGGAYGTPDYEPPSTQRSPFTFPFVEDEAPATERAPAPEGCRGEARVRRPRGRQAGTKLETTEPPLPPQAVLSRFGNAIRECLGLDPLYLRDPLEEDLPGDKFKHTRPW